MQQYGKMQGSGSSEPPPDEGWWNSLLSDEEKHLGDSEGQSSSANLRTSQDDIDWKYLENIYKNDAIISLMVTGYNRGGILVQGEKIQGFVPISHLLDVSTQATEDEKRDTLINYIGRRINLKIIEFVPEEDRIVFSERAAQAGEGKRKVIFSQIKAGDTVSGTVTNVTDFGVFVDLGGLEGLIHVSELSWGRVERPGDILALGQNIDALVLNVSEQSARIALSYKRLTRNPWETILNTYTPGDVVEATISSLTKFGAFARLGEGVEGLIHVSNMQLPAGVRDISKILHVNDPVSVKILHIDPEKKRIGLSIVNG
jgi:small subunit ribosomal protein S1